MASSGFTTKEQPTIIDFSAFHNRDPEAQAGLIQAIHRACQDKGFFQLTNTGISLDLQTRIMQMSKDFFDLPLEEKMKCDLKSNKYHRGYQTLHSQKLEPGAAPDTKEAIYIGEHLPLDHPRVLAGEYNCGPNLYPDVLGEPFERTCTEYFQAAMKLAKDVMQVLALGLHIGENYFDDFCNDRPSSTLRLVHYPPTPQTSALERGVGAHRDFGCVTILLQDEVGGLQIQDEKTGEWFPIIPVSGAFVVNIGNTLMRWTNHHYTSGMHRVMNFSHKERYSVPFFFNGNAAKTIDTIPGCEERKDTSDRPYGPPLGQTDYKPVLLRDYLSEQFQASVV